MPNTETQETPQRKTKRRRSKRSRKTASSEPEEAQESTAVATKPNDQAAELVQKAAPPPEQEADTSATADASSTGDDADTASGEKTTSRRRRRRSSRGKGKSSQAEGVKETAKQKNDKEDNNAKTAPPAAEAKSGSRSRSGRRRRSGQKSAAATSATPSLSTTKDDQGRAMLINVSEGEECRIAIVHQQRLEEIFIERASAESHVGNIYKGRVTNVEPSIQAAFIDFGLPKNGFLHISDLQPQYFPSGRGQPEDVGRKTPRRERPPIQKCLRRGQEIIVQIIKEGIGTKGPTLTTYISIPGRYLVMMPGMNRLGVSRKIEDDDERRKMRRVLEDLDLPKNMGFILRTAGLEKTKRDLQRDHLYLQRLWKQVAQRIKNERAPCELYQESDLVIRTIRDVYSSDFNRIIVDDEETAGKVRDFLSIAMPRSSAPVEVYSGNEPLFHRYGIEAELERINARHVPLPSGGSLVIDSTEALVAIDVNSGRFRDHDDAEQTAYRINLEAAEEIARQLRLRDLGGLILCDFIDMHQSKHQRGVERALREALKKHKERAKCLRMSQFGIIEMTRQRMRPSIKRSIYQDCPHCRGSGLVKNPESMTLDIMRLLHLAAHHQQVETVEVRVSPKVAFQLQNRKRATLYQLEQKTGRRVVIRADGNLGLDQYVFECFDHRGGAIRVIDPPQETRSQHPRPPRRGEPTPPPTASYDMDHNVFE